MRFDRCCGTTILIAILLVLLPSLTAQTPKAPGIDALKRADAAFRAGFVARQSGNLDEARARFAEAARLAPQIPEAHEALGAVLGELGQPAEAVEEFKAALKLKPANPAIETKSGHRPRKSRSTRQGHLALRGSPERLAKARSPARRCRLL